MAATTNAAQKRYVVAHRLAATQVGHENAEQGHRHDGHDCETGARGAAETSSSQASPSRRR
jgi:hypothetical protein